MRHTARSTAVVAFAAALFGCGTAEQRLLASLHHHLEAARIGAPPDPALVRLSLEPLRGLRRDRIEHALGSPTRCPPCPPSPAAIPRDQVLYFDSEPQTASEAACLPCSTTIDEFYRLRRGVILLLHFDATERCTSAEWIPPRVVE